MKTITLEQAKYQLRRFDNDLDDLITDLIEEATRFCESYCDFLMADGTFENPILKEITESFSLSQLTKNDRVYSSWVIKELIHVKVDENELLSNQYFLGLDPKSTFIVFKKPIVSAEKFPIEIKYKTGVVKTEGQVRAASLLYVDWRFNRPDSPMPRAIKTLLDQVKSWRL